MRLDFWNRRDCECAQYEPTPELPKDAERVCRMSPARLLANSLTDPETRGEWTRERNHAVYSFSYKSRNEARDLTLHQTCGFSP